MKKWEITLKEVGQNRPLHPSYVGDVDEAFLVEFFGLERPDVEWYRIDEIIECSICGKEIPKRLSNNAEPVNSGRCCNECNYTIVLPERLKFI